MKKKLYFVVEKEMKQEGSIEVATGYKTVTVYDSNLKIFVTLDLSNNESSKVAIEDYLDDNGRGDEDFDLIQL